jgi:hypothetical protein
LNIWSCAIVSASLLTLLPLPSKGQTPCPRGGKYDDGCKAAPGLGGTRNGMLIQISDFFTGYANQSSQEFDKRPPWNVAGVDYPVGIQTGTILKDPAVNSPKGCTFGETASPAGGPQLRCAGEDPVVEGYEFGEVGAHGCTALLMTNAITGTEVIKNNHFSNCSNTDNSTYLVETQNGSRANVVFSNNVVNGNWKPGSPLKSAQLVFYTTGALTQEYNAVLDMPIRPQGSGCTVCDHIGDLKTRYNLFVSFANVRGGSHGEIQEQTFSRAQQTTQDNTVYSYNTIMQPKTALDGQTSALIYATGGGAPMNPTYNNLVVDHNTEITNRNINGKVTTAVAGVSIANGTYNSIKFIENYIDKTGAYYNFLCEGTNTIVPHPPVLSGNVDIVSGNTIDRITAYKCTLPE